MNEREAMFHCQKTEYLELSELVNDFKPFFDLTQMAYFAQCSIKDWTVESLEKCDATYIETSVNEWSELCSCLSE